MSTLSSKLQKTLTAVNDIEKAINEHGISTKGFALTDYGNLIRSIISELKYPQYATLLLHRIVTLETTAVSIINTDMLKGIFNPTHQYLITDNNNMFHFINAPVLKPYSTGITHTDSNVFTGIIANLEYSTLVELTEQEEV